MLWEKGGKIVKRFAISATGQWFTKLMGKLSQARRGQCVSEIALSLKEEVFEVFIKSLKIFNNVVRFAFDTTASNNCLHNGGIHPD